MQKMTELYNSTILFLPVNWELSNFWESQQLFFFFGENNNSRSRLMSSNNTGPFSSDQQDNNELYNDLDEPTQEEYQVCIVNLKKRQYHFYSLSRSFYVN